MPIEPCRLDQTHDRSRAFSAAQGACEQPVRAPNCPRSDLILTPIIVNGHRAIVEIARQRRPAFKAVIQGLGDGGAFGHELTLGDHPSVQCIDD